MIQLLIERGVMRKILAWMRFPHIDDKEFKSLGAVLLIKPCQWRNLPHEGRSGNTAELQQYVLLSNKMGQRNFRPVQTAERKLRRWRSYFGNGPEVRRGQIALTKRFMVVVIYCFHFASFI